MEMVSLPISLSTLDHELRLSLTCILGWLRFLDKEPLTSNQRQYAQGISESGDRLLKLANTLSENARTIAISSDTPHSQCNKKPYVLLVEDEPSVRLIHTSMLNDLGCRVETATTGEEALAMAGNKYDLILMDVGLPSMSGIEASAEIRKREGMSRQTPIIALTAYTQKETHEQCRAVGINEVATKPITLDHLSELIRVNERAFCSTAPFLSGCIQVARKDKFLL